MTAFFSASLSHLKSRGVPAVQSRAVVVAVTRLQPAEREGWRITLAAGTEGGTCAPVARTLVAGRTRAKARAVAVEVARRYARALSAALGVPLLPLPEGPPLVREQPRAYGLPDPTEPLEHVEIETLPTGGFLLTLTGGGFDGTCVVVAPREAALWQIVEALAALCGGPGGRAVRGRTPGHAAPPSACARHMGYGPTSGVASAAALAWLRSGRRAIACLLRSRSQHQ